MFPVIFILLKKWVCEYEDLHNDKTNTQCRYFTQLLSINKGHADHEH